MRSLAPNTGLKMKMADGVAASAVIRFSTWADIHVGLVGLVVFRSYNIDLTIPSGC